MKDAISMEDFASSIPEATNLNDSERQKAKISSDKRVGWELFQRLAYDADFETGALYRVWRLMNYTLMDKGGWTLEELIKDLTADSKV